MRHSVVGSAVALTVATVSFTGPSQSAGNLPLPPPVYVPSTPTPTDPVPTDPTGNTTANTTEGTANNGAAATPDTPAADTTGATQNGGQTPEAVQPDTIPVAPQTGTAQTGGAQPETTQARSVQLNYAFPANLPEGTVDIVVRDQDGERTVLSGTPSSSAAGATAQQDGVQVRGDATFIVRVNGQEFTSFPAR